jgi:hypothetical protein
MVKVETVGMYDVAKINPTLVAEKAVANYSFITVDGILYLVDNTVVGDDSYKEGIEIPAGDKLNGYVVKAWEGQKLVVDAKHVVDGIASLNKGDVLVANADGKLETGEAVAVHFIVAEKTTLTEPAIKVIVAVGADEVSGD